MMLLKAAFEVNCGTCRLHQSEIVHLWDFFASLAFFILTPSILCLPWEPKAHQGSQFPWLGQLCLLHQKPQVMSNGTLPPPMYSDIGAEWSLSRSDIDSSRSVAHPHLQVSSDLRSWAMWWKTESLGLSGGRLVNQHLTLHALFFVFIGETGCDHIAQAGLKLSFS